MIGYEEGYKNFKIKSDSAFRESIISSDFLQIAGIVFSTFFQTVIEN